MDEFNEKILKNIEIDPLKMDLIIAPLTDNIYSTIQATKNQSISVASQNIKQEGQTKFLDDLEIEAFD